MLRFTDVVGQTQGRHRANIGWASDERPVFMGIQSIYWGIKDCLYVSLTGGEVAVGGSRTKSVSSDFHVLTLHHTVHVDITTLLGTQRTTFPRQPVQPPCLQILDDGSWHDPPFSQTQSLPFSEFGVKVVLQELGPWEIRAHILPYTFYVTCG